MELLKPIIIVVPFERLIISVLLDLRQQRVLLIFGIFLELLLEDDSFIVLSDLVISPLHVHCEVNAVLLALLFELRDLISLHLDFVSSEELCHFVDEIEIDQVLLEVQSQNHRIHPHGQGEHCA